MTDATPLPSTRDAADCKWCVEVYLKFNPNELGLDGGLIGDVVRVWLAATSPGA
jgi:hypothetical protein